MNPNDPSPGHGHKPEPHSEHRPHPGRHSQAAKEGHGHTHRVHVGHLPELRPHTLRRVLVTVLAVFAVLFVVGFLLHHGRVAKRDAMAREFRDQPPIVLVVQPKESKATFNLVLPADVRAYAATALYARTNGYLASWKYDINDRVKKGDVLAVISAPDTDAQLEQAEAQLDQARTSHQLATVTDERYRGLIPIQGVTQEQLDQFRTNREQALATVQSAAATVDRLKALVGFEKIVAPFDGVVTVRTYDVGALISSSNIGAGQELFDVAEDDRLRVFVNVPQPYVELIQYGKPVQLALERNFPGHRFAGVIARSAGTLDPVTRTLRTELDFPNTDPKFHLLPGMYAEALFTIDRPHPVLTIPTSAFLFEAEGTEVALVGPGNRIHYQKIAVGTDFGTSMEVLSGLGAKDRIVANPGEQIAEGMVVSPREGTGSESTAPVKTAQ